MNVDQIARIGLLPVLAAQGALVRARALTLPDPEGPRAGRLGQGPRLGLLIAGDSSAVGRGVSHQSETLAGRLAPMLATRFTVDWRVIATSGDTTGQCRERLAEAEPFEAHVAITALGVNDVTHLVTRSRFRANSTALHELLRDRFGARQILVSGIPPIDDFPVLPNPLRWTLAQQGRRFDATLAAVAAIADDVTHVPFGRALTPEEMSPDGYHPGANVYRAWAETLAPLILGRAAN